MKERTDDEDVLLSETGPVKKKRVSFALIYDSATGRRRRPHVVGRLSDRFQLVIGNDLSLLPPRIISKRGTPPLRE